jgi:basic amino acid/polyamine antiporter, APA family
MQSSDTPALATGAISDVRNEALKRSLGLFDSTMIVAGSMIGTGSLFTADAWNNITFTAREVKNPQRNLPLSLALGTLIVIGLYVCANLAYVVVLRLDQVQHAPSDRVAGAIEAIFPSIGAGLVALAIMISAFGCINGMVMSGARAYFAMAWDGLFFRRAAAVNRARVPGASLMMQGAWAAFLVLIRTRNPVTSAYGNLYSNLLDYVVSAALLFYILTIAGVFRLRMVRPRAERPYRAFGYPVVPALYLMSTTVILAVLFIYRFSTTFPGVVIVLIGVPVYFAFRRSSGQADGLKEADIPYESHH